MSDNSQALVDNETLPHDAERLAEKVQQWLVNHRIIRPNLSDCVFAKEGGYAPGPEYRAAVEPDWSDDGFFRLRTNGLAIHVGRRVFDPGGNGTELNCTACGRTFEPGPEWTNAVGDWFDGNEGAAFACPTCRRSQRLADWRGPWPWGFGNLGFEFWNWPPLSKGFVQAVSEQLQHRIVLVRCRL